MLFNDIGVPCPFGWCHLMLRDWWLVVVAGGDCSKHALGFPPAFVLGLESGETALGAVRPRSSQVLDGFGVTVVRLVFENWAVVLGTDLVGAHLVQALAYVVVLFQQYGVGPMISSLSSSHRVQVLPFKGILAWDNNSFLLVNLRQPDSIIRHRTFFDNIPWNLRIDNFFLFRLLVNNAPNAKMVETIRLPLHFALCNLSLGGLTYFVQFHILTYLHF